MNPLPGPAAAAAKAGRIVQEQALSLRTDQVEYLELVLLAVVVGVLAAFGNIGFRELIDLCRWIFLTLESNALGIGHGAGRLLLPLVLLSGATAIILLDYFFPGDVLGYGFPNFLEMVNLGNARIHRTWIFVKAMGAAVSLGCGASVGREGPIAQIGGAIGSTVAQARRLSAIRSKVLVAAGAGAGIATTFNAPMGGMMFALEIVLLGETEVANLIQVLVSTFSAVVTSRGLFGDIALFRPAPFVIKSYWEMITYALMGVLLGALAAGYIRFFHVTAAFFRRFQVHKWLKLGMGLVIVGGIAIVLPDNLSDGYPIIDLAFAGKLGAVMLSSLAAAKFIASAVSLGCGAPGGVFGPTFFIGTMAGGAFQRWCNFILPGLTGPRGSYALVGLGAFLAGVTHAPLTAILLLFEMTRLDPVLALPAIISTVTALIVAHGIEPESIDTYSLAREGKSLAIGRDRRILTQLPTSSVIIREVETVRANAPATEVLRIASDNAQSTLPVLDNEGCLAGLIVTRDLLSMLAGGVELGALVNAYDLSRQNPPVLAAESSLDQAIQLMDYEALEELPVVEHLGFSHGKFLGLVTRQNIVQAFNRAAVSLAATGTREPNIFWATGYRVTQLRVPETANGKTLRQLDPRARFAVSVLAVQGIADPDSGFTTIAPDQPLRQGDLLIAAGRSADLRNFRRALEIAPG
ncbi:MAG: chloride channel protein [Deltaproteobacteria bacterium]|nr:chloride channel protein [Deltaproteobacteria bacterium]